MSNEWIEVLRQMPPVGIVVNTKIDDAKGCRNEAHLKFQRNLWWYPDGSMYVYYQPTHWKAADANFFDGAIQQERAKIAEAERRITDFEKQRGLPREGDNGPK
jgi:hypothetical protein